MTAASHKKGGGDQERLPVFKAPRNDNPQAKHLPCTDDPQVEYGTTPHY